MTDQEPDLDHMLCQIEALDREQMERITMIPHNVEKAMHDTSLLSQCFVWIATPMGAEYWAHYNTMHKHKPYGEPRIPPLHIQIILQALLKRHREVLNQEGETHA